MEFITNPTTINDYQNQGYIEYAWLFDNGFGLVYKDVLGEPLDYVFSGVITSIIITSVGDIKCVPISEYE
jgi:hypothetical protein